MSYSVQRECGNEGFQRQPLLFSQFEEAQSEHTYP